MSNLFLREVSLDNFSASIRLYSKKYPLEYLLRIRVKRGINLAVRDDGSSDPYAVIGHAWMPILFISTRRLKSTRVIKNDVNPHRNSLLLPVELKKEKSHSPTKQLASFAGYR
ncbi:hypothetical protein Peur_031841 [Populus x canadensis]